MRLYPGYCEGANNRKTNSRQNTKAQRVAKHNRRLPPNRTLKDDRADHSHIKAIPVEPRGLAVAVGTAVTRCPPRGPVLALLAHTVLTSD